MGLEAEKYDLSEKFKRQKYDVSRPSGRPAVTRLPLSNTFVSLSVRVSFRSTSFLFESRIIRSKCVCV